GLGRGEPTVLWRTRLEAELATSMTWLEQLIDTEPIRSHTDALLVDRVLRAWSSQLARMAQAVSMETSASTLLIWSNQLRALFDVELSSFERKHWANLPHEANKAMNINAYLSLVGRAWAFETGPAGPILTPTTTDLADLIVRDADYVVTLDADSILDPH